MDFAEITVLICIGAFELLGLVGAGFIGWFIWHLIH